MEIPIRILSDEKGYFDRECPNEDCLYTFKVYMEDWENKVSDEEVHCPMCGHIDTSDKWWTQEQLDGMEEIVSSYALNYIETELDRTFGQLARSTRNNKFLKITYKPGRQTSFINNPIGQREEWETEIQCEKCGTRYSVIGSAFFCPCCGYNSAISAFNDSLDSIRKMIDSLPEMRSLLTTRYNKDSAETMCRGMLEGTIGDMVSAFQKFASCKYEELSETTARVNDFQIVGKGSELYRSISGRDYSEWLSANELESMNTMFQRRHLIEHNNGIVDQRYIDKSGDTTYSVGRRIIVKEADAYRLLDILSKLGQGLYSIRPVGTTQKK
jgi:ribosomal protein L37E